MARIFISYAGRDDWNDVYQIYQVFTAAGHTVFLDRVSIQPGEDWAATIETNLRAADVVLIFSSDDLATSESVRGEYDTAVAAGTTVIPLRTRLVKVPAWLAHLHAVPFVSPEQVLRDIQDQLPKTDVEADGIGLAQPGTIGHGAEVDEPAPPPIIDALETEASADEFGGGDLESSAPADIDDVLELEEKPVADGDTLGGLAPDMPDDDIISFEDPEPVEKEAAEAEPISPEPAAKPKPAQKADNAPAPPPPPAPQPSAAPQPAAPAPTPATRGIDFKEKSPEDSISISGDVEGVNLNTGSVRERSGEDDVRREQDEIPIQPAPKRGGIPFPNRRGAPAGAPPPQSSPQPLGDPTPVEFTAYHPPEVTAGTEMLFLVYALTDVAQLAVEKDAATYKDQLGGTLPAPTQAAERPTLRIGTPVTVVLYPSWSKDPTRHTQTWDGAWVRYAFRLEVPRTISDSASIDVSVQVRGVEIARIPQCAVAIVGGAGQGTPTNPLAEAKFASRTTRPYQSIFVSYSRQDKPVIDAYRVAQLALGNHVFVDTYSIRVGEDWQAALAKAIDNADVFQLFWSRNSAASVNVRDEWDYALNYKCADDNCEGFIRPVYWELPLPDVPTELSHLNFTYAQLAPTRNWLPWLMLGGIALLVLFVILAAGLA